MPTNFLRMNLQKNQRNKNRKTRVVWMLQLAPSIAQSAKPLYYNGNQDPTRIYLTEDIHQVPWFESKHHANSELSPELKHGGFIAVKRTINY